MAGGAVHVRGPGAGEHHGSGTMGLGLQAPFFPDPGVDLLMPSTSSLGPRWKAPAHGREGVPSI